MPLMPLPPARAARLARLARLARATRPARLARPAWAARPAWPARTPRPGRAARLGRVRIRMRWPARPPAKRVCDLIALAVLLPVCAAPALLAAAALYATRRAGVLVREPALGLAGRPFRTWRLRTDGAGRAGTWVRRCALDGLPQLLNVLRGEMSLVGPRPEPRTDHPERLLVRPGMTGLWQVSARSDLPWEEMALLDRHYVESHWLGLDLAILAKTPRAAFKQRHA
ncbi:sugar transferase [Streptomyces sp. NPDC029216]|uniref:sugar transferase n=1 Tax=Streptomyces sp. NPDC029216 TaxID=3154701 RepID=UPI003404D3D7